MSSSRIFLLKGCPIIRKMSATKSHGILPERLWSKPSKALRRTVTKRTYLVKPVNWLRNTFTGWNLNAGIPSMFSVLMTLFRISFYNYPFTGLSVRTTPNRCNCGVALAIKTLALMAGRATVRLGQQFIALRCNANKLCNTSILVQRSSLHRRRPARSVAQHAWVLIINYSDNANYY